MNRSDSGISSIGSSRRATHEADAAVRRLILRWGSLTLAIDSTHTDVWSRLDGTLDPIRLRRFSVVSDDDNTDTADIEFVEEGPPLVRRTRTGIRVSGPADYWSGGERLACCVLQLIDARRLVRGGLCFHGVSLARDGRAVLLTGPSESGKTSTALRVLQRARPGVGMMSNDHVLGELRPDGDIVLTPNPDVSVAMRSQAIWLSDRDLYSRLLGAADQPRHHERLRVPAATLGSDGSQAVESVLGAVVFVGVGTAETFDAYPTPALRASTALNADLAGRIRAGNLHPLELDGGIGPRLPDLTSPEAEASVDAAVRSIVRNHRAFDARGPVDDIAGFVEHLLESA